ncbi:hypothetical protein QL093DRAFT_2133630 [Fusarium oxysporum]|nr:hypothetical protein QL093DRAFT_2133630 [Fusarium oxysporum]
MSNSSQTHVLICWLAWHVEMGYSFSFSCFLVLFSKVDKGSLDVRLGKMAFAWCPGNSGGLPFCFVCEGDA